MYILIKLYTTTRHDTTRRTHTQAWAIVSLLPTPTNDLFTVLKASLNFGPLYCRAHAHKYIQFGNQQHSQTHTHTHTHAHIKLNDDKKEKLIETHGRRRFSKSKYFPFRGLLVPTEDDASHRIDDDDNDKQ